MTITAKFVPGTGNPNARIAFVGEAPGAYEEQYGKPFVGPSGKILTECAMEAGISRPAIWTTNVSKYRPPNNDFDRLVDIGVNLQDQVDFLFNELRQVNPNVVVAIGEKALNALTGLNGISKYRGSILKGFGGIKVVPTYHPAVLLHSESGGEEKGGASYWIRSIIPFDLKRAREESGSRELNLPLRTLSICNGSWDLYNFLDRYEKYFRYGLDIDIETIKSYPVCVSIAFRESESLSIPLFRNIMGVKLCDITDTDMALIWQCLDQLFRRYPIIGQNIKFDQYKLERLGFRFPHGIYADTAHVSHVLDPELPKNQGFLTSVYTREPFYKDEGGDFRAGRDDISQLLLYNAKDSAVNIEILNKQLPDLEERGLSEFYFGFAREFHQLYMDIEKIGFARSKEQRDYLEVKYKSMWDKEQAELNHLCGTELNVNSHPQVCRLIYGHLGMPKRTDQGKLKADEATIYALIGNHCEKKPDAAIIMKKILTIRQIRKTIGTYILCESDYDGRMRTSFNITGTENGRTSTRILKAPLRREQCGFSLHTLTKHGDVGADVRSQYIADSGFVLMNFDQSQAEARVVANLAMDYDMLRKYDTIDVHIETAILCLGLGTESYPVLLKRKQEGDEPPERFIGKTARHAGNLGMQKKTAATSINTDAKKYGIDVVISEWKAGKILEAFHAANPKVQSVFHAEIKALVESDRKLRSPHGRERRFFGRYGSHLWKEGYSFIPQATVADKTKEVMLACKREHPEFRIIGEAHDAFVALVPKGEIKATLEMVKRHGDVPIDFSRCSLVRPPIIIPWDAEIGENYKDLKKAKKYLTALENVA